MESEYRAAGRADVNNRIDQYSSRVFDALQVKIAPGLNEGRIPRECPAGGAGVYGLDHFWQVDYLGSAEIGLAVARLHDYLKLEGWHIDRYETPPAVPSSVVSARNPKDGYVVWAKGIQDQNRVAVQVSSPCVKVAEGGS
ncbi:hypothetical protein OG948_18270 [Embleya sp. NBC_00888]|nr:hypothetical protein OG948_18270 [Embleya sp. NBC_00888]